MTQECCNPSCDSRVFALDHVRNLVGDVGAHRPDDFDIRDANPSPFDLTIFEVDRPKVGLVRFDAGDPVHEENVGLPEINQFGSQVLHVVSLPVVGAGYSRARTGMDCDTSLECFHGSPVDSYRRGTRPACSGASRTTIHHVYAALSLSRCNSAEVVSS